MGASAGKPDCYEVGAVIEMLAHHKSVAARLAGGGALKIAAASKLNAARPDYYAIGI